MQHCFKVTDHGLQIDKVNIHPGSELILSGKPPAHWSRFGEYVQFVEEEVAPLADVNVATPAAAVMDDAREAAIREAIGALDPDQDYTQGGKPEVDAINAVMDEAITTVTAAERDAVWAKMVPVE